MPIPTCAVLIIFTSLAPSPTLNVVNLFLRINQTMSCFCLGVTLQQMIASHELSNRRIIASDWDSSPSLWLLRRSYPVTTTQHNLSLGIFYLSAMVSWAFVFQLTIAISSETKPHDTPILMAVSRLSPVSIQTLTPACLIEDIVCFTFSWSLSSMAVAPIKISSFSNIPYSYFDV